jgi:hypothetical protein
VFTLALAFSSLPPCFIPAAAVFEAIPFRSAIADGCTHLLVLCTRPSRRRRSLVNDALTDAMEVAIKKAVLSPGYMTAAWKVRCLPWQP